MKKINSNTSPAYLTNNPLRCDSLTAIEKETLLDAENILDSLLRNTEFMATSSVEVRQYLRVKLQQKEREVFAIMFLNQKHHLIEYDEMFKGTIASAAVYPREIAKKALNLNATAVIIAHNHPSGDVVPSQSDKDITLHINSCLTFFDINVLDHFIIGGPSSFSFAEDGLL